MAENLDDGEFWLPPQFLDDDDEDKTTPFSSNDDQLQLNNVDDAPFHSVSFGSFAAVPCSDVSSPVGGSSETESDEDEHLHRVTELTRGFAHSSLDSDSKTSEKFTGGFASGSPQSTLCTYGCRKGSSQGSPNSVCNMCSSKTTWDLLHAAAGEVERMRLSLQEDFVGFNNSNGIFVPQRNSSPPSPPPPPPLNNSTTTNPDFGFYTQQQSLSHQQFQISQVQMLRKYQQQQQQQMAQQQNSVWGGVKNCGGFYQSRQSNQMGPNRGRNIRPLGLSASAWPPLQQVNAKHNQHQHNHHKHNKHQLHLQNQHQHNHHKHNKHQLHLQNQHQQSNQQYGSGLRAVFLNPSGRRECAGTGVFLPRRGCSPESRTKPACSTALVPARVVQALNLKLDDMVGGQPQQQHFHRFNLSSNMEENATVSRLRSNYVQKSNNIRSLPTLNNDIMLPQEWTY